MAQLRSFSRAAAIACVVFAFGCSAKEPDGHAGARDASAGANAGKDGGFSGAQGGTGGQKGDAGTCLGGSDRSWAGLTWTTSAAWLRVDYAGPAVVERSTRSELVLYVPEGALRSAGGAGIAGAGGASGTGGGADLTGARSIVTSTEPLPLMAPGSQVWLFQSDNEKPSAGQQPPVTRGPRLAIRDREHGTLVLGGFRDKLGGSETQEPLSFEQAMPLCTDTGGLSCAIEGRTTYYSVEARADAPVRLMEGESREITLGGIAYELTLRSARSWESEGRVQGCFDFTGYPAGIWVAADILPAPAADVTAELRGDGVLPECTLGNDANAGLEFSLRDVPLNTPHDGPVTYAGMQEGEMTFSLSGSAGVFYLAPAPGFAEPSIGEELWLSMPSFKAFVLRKAERGEVLRAGIASLDVPPVPAELRADFSRGLGVDVTAEPSCTYEPGVELHDAVFAVDPPVRVRSGSSQRVALAGSDYDVSLYAQGNYWALSIVATPPR